MASKYDKYLEGVNPQPNEFKQDTIPDNKEFLLDVELPDQTPSKNKYDKYLKGGDIMDTKVFPRDPETEFGVGQAFLLGLGDSAPDPSELNQNAPGLQLANDGMLYSKGKAVKMYAPLEREIEEAQAIAFQIKASDLPDEDKQQRLSDLRKDFLQAISGIGITQYTPKF